MKFFAILFSILFLSSGGLAQQTDTLTILHVNDTHGNLSSGGPRTPDLKGSLGGLARAATVIGMTRLQDPSALLLHGGDFFIGDLTFNAMLGVAEMKAMQSLGFDAIVMGNHEFDLTPAGFFFALGQSGMTVPLISTNCVLLDSLLLPLQSFVNPFIVKNVKGVKVGIFGMTTPEANVLSMALPQAFLDTSIVPIAVATIDELRNRRGCQVVIMLSHLGIKLDRMLAAAIPGIDAVIGAHDHALVKPAEALVPTLAGGTVPVVQAGAHYRAVGRLRLSVAGGKTSFLDWNPILLDNTIPEAPQVLASVDTIQAAIEAGYGARFFSRQVGIVAEHCAERADSLAFTGMHDTPVGNLVTDAFRAAFRTDIAMTAGGSVAQPLFKGPIVANDIMRMIGYGFNEVNGLGFRMVTFSIPGAAILAGLQFGLSNALQSGNDEFLVQVSGMRYEYAVTTDISGSVPVHKGGIVAARVGSNPIDPGAMYSVTVNEFVFKIFQTILEQLQIPPANVVLADSITEFQVTTAHVAAAGTVVPLIEGRVRCVNVTDASDTKALPTGHSLHPYPNPARDAATIIFSLPAASPVSIAVYDRLGRKVADLLHDVRSAGSHQVAFSTVHLPAGTYHCVLAADGARISRSLSIVR